MRKTILFSIALYLTVQPCIIHGQSKELKVSDLRFSSIFGAPKDDSLHTYCVIGRGFFRAKHSDNADGLFADWLTKHPNARVIPVATHGPTFSGYPDSKMTYCWFVDGKDTVNNYLIKNGCYAGVMMTRIQTWDELSEEDKKKYAGLANLTITIHIAKPSYENFLAQIRADETFAKDNRLGIWKTDQ